MTQQNIISFINIGFIAGLLYWIALNGAGQWGLRLVQLKVQLSVRRDVGRHHYMCMCQSQSLTWQFACLWLFDNHPGCVKTKWSCHLLHQEVTSPHVLHLSHVILFSLAHTYSVLASLIRSLVPVSFIYDFPINTVVSATQFFSSCHGFPVPLVKDFPSLVIFFFSLSPSLSLPPPPHPHSLWVPLCSHGPCMWHEAEPKHPGCPLQPSTVPDLVKF